MFGSRSPSIPQPYEDIMQYISGIQQSLHLGNRRILEAIYFCKVDLEFLMGSSVMAIGVVKWEHVLGLFKLLASLGKLQAQLLSSFLQAQQVKVRDCILI